MKRVYVFGAGSSYASSNNKEGIKNPLDKKFWNTVESLKLLKKKSSGKDSWLYRFLTQFFSEEIKVGMEDVYTFVDSFLSILSLGDVSKNPDHLNEYDGGRPIALLKHLNENPDLKSLVGDFIVKIKKQDSSTSYKYLLFFEKIEQELIELIYNVFVSINGESWDCKLHKDFIEKVVDKKDYNQDTIISFNYDLLLDRAFSEHGLHPNEGFSYYLWLHKLSFIENNWRDKNHDFLTLEENPFPPEDKLELLKLHGSLNWFSVNNSQTDEIENVFYKLIGNLNDLKTDKIYRLRLINERGLVVPKRVLISPITDKLRKIKTQTYFEGLWRRAFEKLKDADEIVFIGYSLPPADYLAKWLFQTSIKLNSNQKKIHLILSGKPKDDETVERYKATLGDEVVYRENRDFKSFVDGGLIL